MAYSTPPQMSVPSQPPRQEVDFGVIAEGFSLLFSNLQVYIIPGLITFAALIPSIIVGLMPYIERRSSITNPFAGLSLLGLQLGLEFIAALATCLLYPGIVLYTLNVVRRKPASTSDLWIGYKDPLGYFAAIFLSGLVSMVGALACIVGVIFTAGLMMFVIPLKVDKGLRASDCLTVSWDMVKSEWFMAGLFIFVVGILSSLGVFACYVGIVITMPFQYIAPTLLYSKYMGYTQPMTQNPYSPYPRGVGYGETIGEQRQPSENPTPPPRPEDLD